MIIRSSYLVLEAAQDALRYNRIINKGEAFEVYEVSPSEKVLTAYALLLFKPNHDFTVGRVPKKTMMMPVTISGRKGYFIERDVALKFPDVEC